MALQQPLFSRRNVPLAFIRLAWKWPGSLHSSYLKNWTSGSVSGDPCLDWWRRSLSGYTGCIGTSGSSLILEVRYAADSFKMTFLSKPKTPGPSDEPKYATSSLPISVSFSLRSCLSGVIPYLLYLTRFRGTQCFRAHYRPSIVSCNMNLPSRHSSQLIRPHTCEVHLLTIIDGINFFVYSGHVT